MRLTGNRAQREPATGLARLCCPIEHPVDRVTPSVWGS